MDEVKIWALDGESGAVELEKKGKTNTELLLEETLVSNPELLMPGLTLVGRQTQTDGGPLDLLGVDEDGRLVVFELKRGTLSREAVAQIIDYGSDLEEKSDDALAKHIAAHSGANGIDGIADFKEWYGQEREGRSLDSLRPLRLVLIGLGADAKTERMVKFLADNTHMDISLLTFHGFAYDGKTLLARQVEVRPPPAPPDDRGKSRTRAELWQLLEKNIRDSGMSEIFGAARGMLEGNWRRASKVPGVDRLSFKLQTEGAAGRRGLRAYAHVVVREGGVDIVFFWPARELCREGFQEAVEAIPYETWRSPSAEEPDRGPVEDPHTDITFKLTAAEWEKHKERLSALTKAVYEAWKSRGQ